MMPKLNVYIFMRGDYQRRKTKARTMQIPVNKLVISLFSLLYI